MAGVKIVDLPAVGRDLISTDLFELSLVGGSGSRKITGQEIMNASKLNVGGTNIINGTVGRILFQGSGDTLGESANLFWDDTNGRLGVGTSTPESEIDIKGNINGTVAFSVNNTNSGTLNESAFLIGQSPRTAPFSALYFSYFGSGYTASGFRLPSSAVIIAGGGATNGMTFVVDNNSGHIKFCTNSNNERLRIASTGNVLINTTTDAGYKLDVNGTARVQNELAVSVQTGNGGINSIRSYGNDLSLATGWYFRLRIVNDSNAILLGTSYDGAQTYLYSERRMVLGNTSINSSAILQSDSTTKGFLPPRMTTTQKNAIASPATGLEVYDSTTLTPSIYNGTNWQNALVPNSNGNVLIGTTTDAGYKLDVNGTFRALVSTETNPFVVQHTNGNYASIIIGNGSQFAPGQFGMYFNGGGVWSWSGSIFRIHGGILGSNSNALTFQLLGGFGGSGLGTSIRLASNTYNAGQFTATSGTQNTVEIGTSNNEIWAPTSGNATYNLLNILPRINTTGTYAGIVRGFYYAPTLTSVTGVTHYAIHTTAGRVRLEGLPTSPTGLSAGDLYNDAGTLKIV